MQSRPGWFGVTITEVQVGQAGQARAIWNDMRALREVVIADEEVICWIHNLGVTPSRKPCQGGT